MNMLFFALCAILILRGAEGFMGRLGGRRASTLRVKLECADAESLSLPPVLEKYANGLRGVTDDKLRYQQLMFLASKCTPMDDDYKTEENKVPGCLSTVYVHASLQKDEGGEDKIFFQGDSDGQLTKGLVAMLVTGLSGCTAEEIEKVDPTFIQYAGIANSLTPGRNNGFLNMLNTMKIKARATSGGAAAAPPQGAAAEDSTDATPSATPSVNTQAPAGSGPIYAAMVEKLSKLQPVSLEIENESHKHAGHAGMAGADNTLESHFNVKIVAESFHGLSLVQRHRMIYALLAKEMAPGGIHALSINAKTPAELA